MHDDFGVLRVATEGAVAKVTIDNPPTNLVNGPFIGGLIAFVDALEATRAYEANIGVIEVTKSMADQALRIIV